MSIARGPVAYAPSDRGYVAHQVTGTHGPWLVLLPTLTASFSSYWELPSAAAVLEQLAAHCRLVLLDRRGTGPSDPLGPGEVPDAATHAADVSAVLAHLDATDVTVVGESYAGGPAALHAAALTSGRIGSVVTLNLPLSPVIGELHLDAGRIVDDVLWGAEEPQTGELGLELMPSVSDDPVYGEWAERAGRATSPAVARALWESMLAYDLTAVVDRVTVPVTVIDTGHWTAPAGGVAALAGALRSAEIVTVPRVDTLLFVGDTQHLVAELLYRATGARHSAPATRRLLAVLFTDLVGSTELAAELGDRAWRSRLDRHDQLVDDLVVEHHGTVVKHTGDGALATFPLGSTAVHCALELINALDEIGLPTRAGVHVGEVELRDGDVGGLAVHVAARVAAAATAGELLVTEAVRLSTLGVGVTVARATEHELRGVPGTWTLSTVHG